MPKLMHMHVYTLGGFGIIIAFCRLDICSTDETCNFDDVTRLNDGILFVLFYESATKVYRSLEDSGGQVLFGVGWQWSTEEELQRRLNQSSLIWDISFFFFSFLAYALGGNHERCGFELCHVSINKNHRNSLRSHCNFWKQTALGMLHSYRSGMEANRSLASEPRSLHFRRTRICSIPEFG